MHIMHVVHIVHITHTGRDAARRARARARAAAPLVALAALLTPIALAACGGDGAAEAVRAPERAGEVWELDRTDDGAAVEGALLAYVNGLHVMVLDDDDAFTGMTRLRATAGDGGRRAFTLANGLGVELAPAGDALELRFAGGQVVPLRRQPTR